MSRSTIEGARVAGVVSTAPTRVFDNVADTQQFDPVEVRKVVAMAGVARRRIAAEGQTSADLCTAAARRLLDDLGWAPASIDGLLFVTQTPDHFLPSTSCVVHRDLGLPDTCAALDVGLGCSGYPYGLWLAHMMIASGGLQRILLLHGETPSKFTWEADRATFLLFGDAGSATGIERAPGRRASFVLHTDGTGANDLIVRAGAFRDRWNFDRRKHHLEMNGANLFTFTIKRIAPLITDTVAQAGCTLADVDLYVLHQSNRFMMMHVARKLELPETKLPMTLADYGNTGGPSLPLTLTQALPAAPREGRKSAMLVGYGVGLSWGAALIDVDGDIPLRHIDLEPGPSPGQ